MAVVTVAGQHGSAAQELAHEVASRLGADYVDRQVIATAAARIGVAQQVLERKESRPSLGERISRVLQTFLERSAAADPTLGPSGVEVLLSRTYTQALEAESQGVSNARYVEIIKTVTLDLAKGGNVVILRRGGQAVLQDMPHVLRVHVSSSWEDRVQRLMQREGLARGVAEKQARDLERERLDYHRKFFKINADSPGLYHLMLNVPPLPLALAADLVAQAARALEAGSGQEGPQAAGT